MGRRKAARQGTGHMATVHVAGAEEATGTHSHRRQQSPEGKRETVLGLNLSFVTCNLVTSSKPLNSFNIAGGSVGSRPQ